MPPPFRLYFEDILPGPKVAYGDKLVTAGEIVEFARMFDPRPMHLGEEEARDTPAGELIASGWHACGMMMRMLYDAFLHEAALIASPGLQECRLLHPIRPGDRLHCTRQVIAARRSLSQPRIGRVNMQIAMFNQDGAQVLAMDVTCLFHCRGAAEPGP